MANLANNVPGVHLQEKIERSSPILPTGVPVFVGLVTLDAQAPAGAPQDAARYGPVALHRKLDFPGGACGHLAHALSGFFDNGGAYCYVVGVRIDPEQTPPSAAAAGLIDALDLAAPLADVDLLAVPDAVGLAGSNPDDESLALQVQIAMLQHCREHANRVALLDCFRDSGAQGLIERQVQALRASGQELANAALYQPWIRTIASGKELIPPCGHIAGVISRTDAAAGVFKAPANVEIQGAVDLEVQLDPDSLALLNDAGVNSIRAFPIRGIRVWGARTLSSDPAWRYLNVRRLVLTLSRWIDLNMKWAAFEPNVPALWSRIKRELTVELTRLWRAGALQGDSPSEAFRVRCDAELNPSTSRELGRVETEVSLAPLAPAEFIVVSVQHRAGTTELL